MIALYKYMRGLNTADGKQLSKLKNNVGVKTNELVVNNMSVGESVYLSSKG